MARERKEEKWQREHALEELMRVDEKEERMVGWDEDDFM